MPSITSVWPALWPPWKRTTMSACSDSQSTIFPLPSSPHWAPTTTTLAMQCLSPRQHQIREDEIRAHQQRLVQAQAPPGIEDRATPGKAVRVAECKLSPKATAALGISPAPSRLWWYQEAANWAHSVALARRDR